MSAYEKNRANIPPAELQKHAGPWVAFSLDGSRVLGSAETLRRLEEWLVAAGQGPQQAAFERIEAADSLPGGAEFL